MMPDFQVNDCMQSIPGTADDLHLIEVGYLKHLRVGLPEEQASSVVALAASTCESVRRKLFLFVYTM